MTKERLAVLEDKHKQTFLTFDECQELLSAARESIRLQAENAKLRKHCMMMATSPNQELLNRDREAYRADFPKEPDK